MIDIHAEVQSAENRIRQFIRNTPLEYSANFSELANASVHLKLENIQHTGSFKVRGALNKILSLSGEERKRGIVTASSGNHGLAVAFSLNLLNTRGAIFLPEQVSKAKLRMLEHYDVELKFCPGDPINAEKTAQQHSVDQDQVYVSPYNDPQVIGGQGTIGLELLDTTPEIDCVFVAVGGGGMISGIAGYLKALKPNVQIIGCVPQNSPVMYESVKAGKVVEWESSDTLSDGTAGGIDLNAITFEPCQRLVDNWVVVNEEEIAQAMKLIFHEHRLVIEGAAGVPVAAYLQMANQLQGKNVAIILCGANIAIDKFKKTVL